MFVIGSIGRCKLMLSEKVRSGFGDGRRKQEYKNEIIKKNMANNEPGYVYILTNHCYRADWVKIGKSCRPRRGIEYMDQRTVPWS